MLWLNKRVLAVVVYDIACAQNDTAITDYKTDASVESIQFHP
jgi:hypothetical protein